jgi:hypothetical protein
MSESSMGDWEELFAKGWKCILKYWAGNVPNEVRESLYTLHSDITVGVSETQTSLHEGQISPNGIFLNSNDNEWGDPD